jgi:hypothetical protein
MARPWPKKSKWPHIGKSGRRSYLVGCYDHERRERSRSFPSVRHARAWMEDYITAERRGRESLRRFLLDLDAKDASDLEARTIGEVLTLYLAVNAHPRNEGGLAPSTFERYEQIRAGTCSISHAPAAKAPSRRQPPGDWLSPRSRPFALTGRKRRARGVSRCSAKASQSRRAGRRGVCSRPR